MHKSQEDLIEALETSIHRGLTRDEASKRRQDDESFNVVPPPINCPAWVCCLLPCIKSIPSMKTYREILPEEAEILRDGKWTRYDSSNLVTGDIIKLVSGDRVPADCVLLKMEDDEPEMLVDVRAITGEEKPRSVSSDDGSVPPLTLYLGGLVLQGSALAVVTATGPATLLASLIRSKRFPPRERVLVVEDEAVGIPLVSKNDGATFT